MEPPGAPAPATGGPPGGCPSQARGGCGMLGLGPPPPRWAAAGPARRPCLVSGLRSRPGPLGLRPAGPGSGPLRSLLVAPGVAWPTGGPPAPVGAAPGLPRRAPLRRGRVRAVAGLPRPVLGPLLGGSGPGGSGRLPPPGGAAALLPPPVLRPLPRRAGSPCPGPCRAAPLPRWAAAPPPSGGGWGGCAALPAAAAPSVGDATVRPCRPGSRRAAPWAALDRPPLRRP